MRRKTELFKVLSEPNRIKILMMLMQRPLCVCEITSILGLTTATISSHLSYLRKEGFIDDYKDGKWINYKIKSQSENIIIDNILKLLPDWMGNEPEIKEVLSKVPSVDRYQITCSPKAG